MARVWQDIEAGERRSVAEENVWRTWLHWPSLAQQFALVALLLAAVVAVHGRRARSPGQVAQGIEQVAPLARVPSVAVLKDFEAIRRLNQASADVELLAAFEQLR